MENGEGGGALDATWTDDQTRLSAMNAGADDRTELSWARPGTDSIDFFSFLFFPLP